MTQEFPERQFPERHCQVSHDGLGCASDGIVRLLGVEGGVADENGAVVGFVPSLSPR